MDEEQEPPQSRAHANKMIRVLAGIPNARFTVTVHHKDGTKTEWQSNACPKIDWSSEARCMWLIVSDYPNPSYPIMPWRDGDIIHCEQNPDWVDKK